MLLPKKLKIGDTIGIIAPSNYIDDSRKILLYNAIEKLESFGFRVKLSKNIFAVDKYGVSAGTPEQRSEDLNAMFFDPDINCIWCFLGGETANEILGLIDYENIKQNPKIFLGMSDIDVLHLAIQRNTELVTFNADDPKVGLGKHIDIAYSWESFQERLMYCKKEISPAFERKIIRKGSAEGRLIGCNINSILKLAGTEYFPDFKGKIFFLEAYTEGIRETISALTNLKNLGVFDSINGIVVGYILGFEDPDWKIKNNITHSFEEILLDIIGEKDIPIIKTKDFGHYCPNCFLPLGAKVSIDTQDKSIEIVDDFIS